MTGRSIRPRGDSVGLGSEPWRGANGAILGNHPGEGLVQPAEVGFSLGEKLGGVIGYPMCRWENSRLGPCAPVDVLEAARGVVGGRDAERFLVLPVPGRGKVGDRQVPAEQFLLDSKRTMMCRLYVASSAETRINDGITRLSAAWNWSSVTSAERLGERCSGPAKPVSPERPASPDGILQSRDCDS